MSDNDCKRCPKCEGSGMIGECVNLPFGGRMFIDYECPRCKGRGYVERKARKQKRTCEMCKHSRWFGEYAMTVCEKHGPVESLRACGDYKAKKRKGGEE